MNNASREAIANGLLTLLSAPLSFQGNTHSTVTVDGISAYQMQGMYYGMPISGAGIATGSTIAGLAPGAIALSIPATATGTGVSLSGSFFKTTTRKLIAPQDYPPEMKPALVLWDPEEDWEKPDTGVPPIAILTFEAFIYITSQIYALGSGVGGSPAMSILNPIVDGLQQKITPPLSFPKQQIGVDPATGLPLCEDCYFQGRIEKRPGDMDGLGVAVVPIKVRVPW